MEWGFIQIWERTHHLESTTLSPRAKHYQPMLCHHFPSQPSLPRLRRDWTAWGESSRGREIQTRKVVMEYCYKEQKKWRHGHQKTEVATNACWASGHGDKPWKRTVYGGRSSTRNMEKTATGALNQSPHPMSKHLEVHQSSLGRLQEILRSLLEMVELPFWSDLWIGQQP